MSTTQVSKGDTPQIVLTGTATAGVPLAIGHSIVIPLVSGTSGQTIAVAMEGIFTVPKVSAAVFVAGEKLLWDSSAAAFDDSAATPAAGDIMGAVVAVVAGANTETTCTVKLTPGNAALT